MNGSKILSESYGDKFILYIYDETDSIIGMLYRESSYAKGTFDTYVFVKNLQGDVIAIYDKSGTCVANYTYNAWGECTLINATGSIIGTKNPFRYRGYYCDTETGFYYLNSRYYDPKVKRFISADTMIANVGGDICGYNVYAYCFNSPVIMHDYDGYWPENIKNAAKWIVKKVIDPIVTDVKKTVEKLNITYSTGINISGTTGLFVFNLQFGVAVDTKGNVDIQYSIGAGFTGGTPSISISKYQSFSNASSVNDLRGMGYQIGMSSILPVSYSKAGVATGFDFNIIPNSNGGYPYFGTTRTTGVGVGIGSEFHIEWGVTKGKRLFNVFELYESAYGKIMGW